MYTDTTSLLWMLIITFNDVIVFVSFLDARGARFCIGYIVCTTYYSRCILIISHHDIHTSWLMYILQLYFSFTTAGICRTLSGVTLLYIVHIDIDICYHVQRIHCVDTSHLRHNSDRWWVHAVHVLRYFTFHMMHAKKPI